MTTPSNATRAALALDALRTYAEAAWFGLAVEEMGKGDVADCIGDLMACLMHLAKSRRLNVAAVVESARMHFEAEGGAL